MEVSANMVKDLREKTGAGMMDCKKALTETGGDFQKAVDYLRQKGLATAAKRAGRIASEGRIGSYIHAGGKIGVMVEVNCETDFVAKTDDFQVFAKDIAMHIAASNPLYIRREEVTPEALEREKEIYRAQARDAKKPEKIMDKIVEGKLEKVLRRGLPPGAALRQRPRHHHPGPPERVHRKSGREGRNPPFRPFPGRRRDIAKVENRPQARLPADPPQAQRRGPGGGFGVRHQPGGRPESGRGGEGSPGARGGGRHRHRRREHLPRSGGQRRAGWTGPRPITWACWPR